MDIVAASSDRWASIPIQHKLLSFPTALAFQKHNQVLQEAPEGAIALLATPAKTSAELAPKLLEKGLSVIDLSGAFRMKEPALYPQWYGFEHPCPELLSVAHYGLVELFPFPGKAPTLIANPGCYATAAILCSAPLVRAGLIEGPIMFDGKSGTTGAGRSVKEELLFSEVDENLRPYRVGAHQHTPEIEQALGTKACLTAHLIPMRRGILVSAYAPASAELQKDPSTAQAKLDRALREAFSFGVEVRVRGGEEPPPETAPVLQSNHAVVHAKYEPRTSMVLAFSAIDNLVKGAAGQAIQNLELLLRAS